MNKKFLFFKLSDHIETELEAQVLSELEVTGLFDDVKPIDNIFQLMQQPEIKRVVEKEVSLQNALTDRLADHGRHGYLWTGTELPDVVKGLSRLAFTREIYLFQQLLDPEPDFLKNPFDGRPFTVFNIYLWRVYRIWTRQYLLERAVYIRNSAANEVEIDHLFEDLLRNLRSDAPESSKRHLLHQPVNTSVTFNQDRRPYISHHDTRWIRSLINHLLPENGKTVLNPFCGNGEWLLEGLLAGQNATGVDINPLVTRIAVSNMANFGCSLPELGQAISDIISHVKMIVNETATPQTDLFLFGTESKFMQFWNTEKARLKSLQFATPDDPLMKYFAATRFIIESEAVSRDQPVNRYLMTALINLMISLLRRKKEIDFCEEYRRRLRQIYLNCYVVRKVQSLFPPPEVKGKVLAGDIRDQLETSGDLILVNVPVRINKSGFEKDRAPIEIMNLHGAGRILESKLFGTRVLDEADKTDWQMLLEDGGAVFPLLNDRATGFLERLKQADRHEDALRFFILWSQYHNLLAKLAGAAGQEGAMCLIAEHPFYKIGEEYEEVPVGAIIQDMLRRDETKFPFSEINLHIREEETFKFGYPQRTSILLLKKRK
jgi:hypothetical protein